MHVTQRMSARSAIESGKQGGNTGRSRPFLRDDFFISLMNFERKENDAGKAEEHQRRGAQSHRSG